MFGKSRETRKDRLEIPWRFFKYIIFERRLCIFYIKVHEMDQLILHNITMYIVTYLIFIEGYSFSFGSTTQNIQLRNAATLQISTTSVWNIRIPRECARSEETFLFSTVSILIRLPGVISDMCEFVELETSHLNIRQHVLIKHAII